MDRRYIPVSYVQQTGTQFINTGLRISSGSIRAIAKYSFDEVSNSEANLFGNFYNWPDSSGLMAFGIDDSAHIRSVVSQGNSFRYATGSIPVVGTMYTAEVSINSTVHSITINGLTYTGNGYSVGTEELYVFCNGAEKKHFAKAKLYSLQIYDGNSLIADFIPTIDSVTGTAGLYNNVTDIFHGNENLNAPTWAVRNDELYNILALPLQDSFETLPDAIWRIDQMYNQGFPFNNLMIGLSSYTINPVEQYNYISIYDMWTPQNGFDNNGICLLEPISCKVTEQLNGGWEMHLEIPIDEDGKWEYVKQGNYIKLLGQIFTINKVELAYSGNSGKLTAWGEHIFYQLNDPWISEGTRIVGTTDPAHQASTGNSIIAAAVAACVTHNGSEQLAYDFGHFSDLTYQRDGPQVALYGRYKWNGITSGMTLIDFLLGGDGFIASLGGELYRDNFYFSINKRMEHAQDDAFELRAGLNITSIRRTVDLSTYCTYFKAYTDDGYWWAVAWDPSTVIDQYPHNIVREKKFSVNTYNVSGVGDFESRFKMMLLATQAQAWFSQNCMPSITYVINVKDLAKNPEYSDISMFRFKVGDKGRIYDERYGRPITVQVTRTVTDAVTGEVLQVQFGSTRSFTRTSGYKPIEESDIYVPVPQAMKFRLKDSMGRFLKDSQSRYLAREVNLNE